MDHERLYRQGVLAIREQGDIRRGRALLLKALELQPEHDMAWLWLTRTVQDSHQQLEYVERALAINPANETARKLKARLLARAGPDTAAPGAPPAVKRARYKTVDDPVTPAERQRIDAHMAQAATHLEAGAIEDAIREWVAVLALRVDHETALRNAAGHLWQQDYRDDAVELVQRALDAGTRNPTIYLTAIDMAERQGRYTEADALRRRLAEQPATDDKLLLKLADDIIARQQPADAFAFLDHALGAHPDSQALLLRLGDLYREFGQQQEAVTYYERVVQLGARTPEGKTADKRLGAFVPVLTDRERGSVLLALRETAGITLFYLVLGWQDAGIDLLALGPRRWFGVLLSAIGGYLVVTATSSPQQRGIAAWLGGRVPPPQPDADAPVDLLQQQQVISAPGRALEEPTRLARIPADARYILGGLGILLLLLAFYMVAYHAVALALAR